ncbi:PAS domain-containing protein [Desulfonatronum thioautotrophicum]|uniref:PAS domain-containing protein n=1 Tax=Desulfonatronum thioautotrophicum TaxID=617001 RepID=UPI0013791F4C|nr:PAS domain-containing protein [Desulfonatronum thioautotrophicum]
MPEISRQLSSHIPSRTVIIYVLVAGAWIAFSDYLLAMVVDDPDLLTRLQTYKGWLFVLVTAVLLYFVLRGQVRILEEKSRQLIRHEQQFHQLVDNAPLPIIIQTQGTFAYLNNQALQLYGVSAPEELLGVSVLARVHPRHHEDVRKRLRLVNEERQSLPVAEQTHLRQNGEQRLVELSAVPFTFHGHDGAVVFARDVTRQRRTEAVVQALLRNSPNLISVFDTQGRYVLVSTENAKAIGQAVDQIIGRTFSDVLPQTLANTFLQRIARIVAEERPLTVLDETGGANDRRVLETSLFPVSWRDGRVELVGAIAMDVTQRIQDQKKLQAWHDLMQDIIHYDPSAIAVLDREMRHIYVSQRFLDDYGVTQEVMDRNHYEVFPDIPEKWREVHKRALQGEVLRNDDDVFIRSDGQMEFTRWLCRPWRDADGAIGGIVLYTEVITPLRRVERELRDLNRELENKVLERTARLEEANKELEAFSYSVSHDLRAPLRGIDGFSQALLEDYHDQLDEQGRDYLQRVRKASQRMGMLIDDLLKLSRVSRAELNPAPVDLSRMVEQIAATLRESDPELEVTFIVEPDVKVEADPALLRIVMGNLLDNAYKFTRYVAKPRVVFGQRLMDGNQVCFLQDNGAGFDMAYADKLFTAFQRLHSAERYPGTGVGLATTARIIRRHGGRIWAEAEPDQGATFYFTLSQDTGSS